jgi:hypothetical protein
MLEPQCAAAWWQEYSVVADNMHACCGMGLTGGDVCVCSADVVSPYAKSMQRLTDGRQG